VDNHNRIDVDKAFDTAIDNVQGKLSIEDRLDNIEAEMSATRQLITHISDSVMPMINEILAAATPLIKQLETSTSPVARAIRMSLGIKAAK